MIWKCPNCKRERESIKKLVLCVCVCGEKMEVIEDGEINRK